MRQKDIIELIVCVISTILVVLAVLVMVWVFEKFNIHVPGSREMWIGLIGAVLGGAFTMFGVLITIHKQEKADDEKNRLEHMPILGFEIVSGEVESDANLSCIDGELCTSAFLFKETKDVQIIKISVINNLCAFNFTIEECAIDGNVIPKGDAFAPTVTRLGPSESKTLAFDYSDSKTNVLCVIRFSYEDIFGNKYFQELPFTYFEVGDYISEIEKIRQVIEIRDIKAPIFRNGTEKLLKETMKNYSDYEVLCKETMVTSKKENKMDANEIGEITENLKDKKILKYIITILVGAFFLLCVVFVVPHIINSLYLKNVGYMTVWGGEDVLSFYGDVLAFLGTSALGILSLYQNHVFKAANEKAQKEQEERTRNEKRPIYQFEYTVNEKNNLVLIPVKTPNTVGFNERVIESKLLDSNKETEIFVTDWNNPFEFEFNTSCSYDANEFHYMRMTLGYTDMFNCTVYDTYWLLLTSKKQCCAILEKRMVYDKDKSEIPE